MEHQLGRYAFAGFFAWSVCGCAPSPAVPAAALQHFGFTVDAVTVADRPAVVPTVPVLPPRARPAAPAGGPSGTVPTAAPSAPATPVPTPPLAASGGGGSGSAPAPAPIVQTTGQVADEQGAPIAGAVVALADGRSATTDASGRFVIPGSFVAGPIDVSEPRYVASRFYAVAMPDVLHLRRAAGPTDPFDQFTRHLTGRVTWPGPDHVGGEVYYVDDLQSVFRPVAVASDGTFSLDVTPYLPGTPHGLVLVRAQNAAGQPIYGLSAPADLAGDLALPAIAMAPAETSTTFDAGTPPAGLASASSRLEVVVPGSTPVVLERLDGTSGSFAVPAPGSLPGTTRVVVSATSPAGDLESVVAFATGGAAAATTFLAPPAMAVDARTREVSWDAVSGASGYHIEVRPRGATLPTWEAWTDQAVVQAIAPLVWPVGGEALVEAVEPAGEDTRQIASVGPRALRVEPWLAQPVYRLASRRVTF